MLLLYILQVCELDLVFNYEISNYILNEFVLGGEILETGKKQIAQIMREYRGEQQAKEAL